MDAIRVLAIDHIVLRCKDLNAMLDFYCGTLGFEVAKRNEARGLVHLRAGSAMIDLVTLDGPLGASGGAAPGAGGRNLDHFCLRVDPFDAAACMRRFEALGIAPSELRSRFGGEGDGLSFYVHDPEGNRVEIKGAATTAS
jgi:catechol 2,3-dioxygenase-like lactoylglutathione lyase family enzyme